MTSVSHADYDRLLLGSPLRRRPVCIVICVALLVALSLATLIHLGLLASMRLDVHNCSPRDPRAMAQSRIPPVLALEIPLPWRSAANRRGLARADPTDER